MMLNLREAAELAGTTKSSIWRAIRSGRLSCTKDEFGGVHIDPAEIARVYPPKPPKPERLGPEQAAQSATDELRMRNAALEAQINLFREMVDSLKAERDRWAAQAERLALSPPSPIITPPPAKEPAAESPRRSVPTVIVSRRSWWPFRRTG
jgi:hypothetical protein